MIVLLIAGGLMIMARYLIFTDSNVPTLIGLAASSVGSTPPPSGVDPA